jgi:DNA replication and repair protein RecF
VLTELTLTDFRNIRQATIAPSSSLNLVIGENGSGKTSLLEAIYLLAMGRSFRSRFLKQVVNEQADTLTLFGKINNQKPLGLRYEAKTGLQIRLDNAPLKRLSDLALSLPVQFIPPNCHAYFEDGPKYRRRIIDWGLFHVEQQFNFHWQSYKKGLQQRNAAIKQKQQNAQIQVWDVHLVKHAKAITEMRSDYLKELFDVFIPIFKTICPIFDNSTFTLRYSQGWQKDTQLSEQLSLHLERDKALGYTRSGAHAADWLFRIDNTHPGERLSRGQQKLFFLALSMAQIKLLKTSNQLNQSILLIDDLSSELDAAHQLLVIDMLRKLSVQTFISSTNMTLENEVNDDENEKLFHVKQGVIHG